MASSCPRLGDELKLLAVLAQVVHYVLAREVPVDHDVNLPRRVWLYLSAGRRNSGHYDWSEGPLASQADLAGQRNRSAAQALHFTIAHGGRLTPRLGVR